jgi:hypothetical protein
MFPDNSCDVAGDQSKKVSAISYADASGSGNCKEPEPLQQVHREVLDAFSPVIADNQPMDLPDPPYKKFLKSIVSSGSDKAFFIQKKYKHVMDPIVETSEGVTGSGERVDLGENESDSDSDSEDSVEPRTAILALVAPSLEHEHTTVVIPVEGRQPEPEETREALCS